MKFEVTRTSMWSNEEPCEESYSEITKNEYGTDEKTWFIEINSLKDLCNLSKKYGDLVFNCKNQKSAIVEIYDDYRE